MSVEEFYSTLAEGKVLALKCASCEKLALPPKLRCPGCGSTKLERVEVAGEGHVVSYSVVHVPPMRLAERAPYAVAVVELESGLLVEGIVAGDPSKVKVGTRVKVATEAPPEAGWPRLCRLVFEVR